MLPLEKSPNQKADGLEIAFFETVNIGNGHYADNPWLQEMPDPVTRCVWENYLQIPIEFDGNRRFDGVGPFKGFNSKEAYKEAQHCQADSEWSRATTDLCAPVWPKRRTV